MTTDIDLTPDTTIGQLYFSKDAYSAPRLSCLMQEIIGRIPRI